MDGPVYDNVDELMEAAFYGGILRYASKKLEQVRDEYMKEHPEFLKFLDSPPYDHYKPEVNNETA